MRIDSALRFGSYTALAALVGAFGLEKIRSLDYWWHLAIGDWIARNGRVPRVDVFTFSVPGAPYVDIHWLHQLGLHALYAAGGHDAVIVAKLALLALTVTLLAFAMDRWERPGLVVGALALGLCAQCERITARPEITTFALLAAELWLLERWRRRPGPGVFGIVALQLLWVNVHGLFVVGLGVIGMAFVGQGLDALRYGRRPDTGRRMATLAAVGLLSGVVSLLNPNGLHGLLYPVRQLFMIGSPEMRSAVGLRSAELHSLVLHWHEVDPLVRAGFVGLLGLGGLSLVVEVPRLRTFDVLLFGAFLALALTAVRNVALFGVAVPLVLVRNLGNALDRRPTPVAVDRALAGISCAAILALAAWTASGRMELDLRTYHSPGLGVTGRLFPEGAADWILREHPAGPLYHHMADGGYLMWRLQPEYPVLADGRLEVFGSQAAELFQTSPEGFVQLDRRFRFGAALLSYNHYDFGDLFARLRADRRWRLAYVDDVAVVFVRRQPGTPFEPDVDVRAPDLFPPLGDRRSLSDLFARRGRARFYALTGQMPRAMREVESMRARYPAWVGRP